MQRAYVLHAERVGLQEGRSLSGPYAAYTNDFGKNWQRQQLTRSTQWQICPSTIGTPAIWSFKRIVLTGFRLSPNVRIHVTPLEGRDSANLWLLDEED